MCINICQEIYRAIYIGIMGDSSSKILQSGERVGIRNKFGDRCVLWLTDHCTVGTRDPVQLPIRGHCTSRIDASEFCLLGKSKVLELIRRGPPVEDGGHRVYHGYLLDKRVKSFFPGTFCSAFHFKVILSEEWTTSWRNVCWHEHSHI